MVRVKVCCISSVEEARIAVAAGVSAVGLVSVMPSGPGVIDEETIAEIVGIVPPGVATFLLTSAQDPEMIVGQQRRTCANVLQLVDYVEKSACQFLKKSLPGIKVVQVVHIISSESVQEAEAAAVYADALLLDSGNPNLTVKELGGTGRIHDWNLSREIRKRVNIPVYLAGGLRPENVRDAIQTVEPFGVDVCSGARTDGRLDPEKLRAFMQQVTR